MAITAREIARIFNIGTCSLPSKDKRGKGIKVTCTHHSPLPETLVQKIRTSTPLLRSEHAAAFDAISIEGALKLINKEPALKEKYETLREYAEYFKKIQYPLTQLYYLSWDSHTPLNHIGKARNTYQELGLYEDNYQFLKRHEWVCREIPEMADHMNRHARVGNLSLVTFARRAHNYLGPRNLTELEEITDETYKGHMSHVSRVHGRDKPSAHVRM
ncbi:MAG: hypothetical protein K0R63_1168 [Rickettsiales bacterium]|jgi:hypothetical protein|nr:hypothetical protein [Rickettsiales bacterium]